MPHTSTSRPASVAGQQGRLSLKTLHQILVTIDLKGDSDQIIFKELATWLAFNLCSLHLQRKSADGQPLVQEAVAVISNHKTNLDSLVFLSDYSAAQFPKLQLESSYNEASGHFEVALVGPALASASVDLHTCATPSLPGLALLGALLALDRADLYAIFNSEMTRNPAGKAAGELMEKILKDISRHTLTFMTRKDDIRRATSAEVQAAATRCPRSRSLLVPREQPPCFARTGKQPWTDWHQALIPKGIEYFVSGGEMEVAECALGENKAFMLVSEPGLGKTVLAQYLAQKHQMPLLLLNGHGKMQVEDLLGGLQLKDGNTVVELCGLARAMAEGFWVMINEPNAIPTQVLQVLYSALDTTEQVVVGNRVVRKHPDCRFMFSANPPGYRGASPMPEPLLSRIHYKLGLPSPSEAVFRGILGLKCPKAAGSLMDKAWAACQAIRNLAGEEGGYLNPGTLFVRSAISWLEACRFMSPADAFHATVLAEWQDVDQQEKVRQAAVTLIEMDGA